MAKKKGIEQEVESTETEAVAYEQPVEKKSGKWVAKVNVICGQGISLKKGDVIPSELLEELKAEGFAEQAV